MKTVFTQRLIVRPHSNRDFDDLSSILADPKVMQFVFTGKPFSKADTEKFIQENFLLYEATDIGLGIISENSSDRIIGCAGITPFNYAERGDIEFGFALGRFAWRQGYATEIGQGLINQALGSLGYARLYATAHPDNTASRKVIEKLGMQFVKEIKPSDRGKRLVYCIEKAA